MKRRDGERGAAAVEFALIALVLITMLFAIIEGGRLFMIQASLSSAAREAARELALKQDAADLQAAAAAAFPFGTPTVVGGDVTDCPTTPQPTVNNPATVVLEFEVDLMTGLFVDALTLRGEGTMRCGG